MKIQILSDIHLEFGDYGFQDAGADVVVLAGDIHTKNRGLEWVLNAIPGDMPIIYVYGNHELYGKSLPSLIDKGKLFAKEYSRLHVLEDNHVAIDGVNFFGATFWTDFELFGTPEITGRTCQDSMTDYKKIRRSPSYSKMRSIDTAIIHYHSKRWLEQQLLEHQGERNVVVTHHAPSTKSLEYPDDELSAAYASDLDSFILEHQPALWIHGHLHASSDYLVGNTRVICNAKGYPLKGHLNEEFDAKFVVDLEVDDWPVF